MAGLGWAAHPGSAASLSISSWKRTAELVLKKQRGGRLHARS